MSDTAPPAAQIEDATVGDVMHPGVVVCGPEAPARHVARLMARHNVHAIVVWGDDEEGGPWGVVADTDLLEAFGRPELEGSAGALARTPIVSVGAEERIVRAAELMRRHRVTHLVVTAHGRPVGIVSTLDLARAVAGGSAEA